MTAVTAVTAKPRKRSAESMKRLVLLCLAILLISTTAFADAVRPVTMRMKEREPGLFLVQWRVSDQLPAGAIPSPVLPDSRVRVGDRSREERGGTWILQQTFRCPGGLSGQVVGIEYPVVNVTVPTLLRVELLSGKRYARMLPPGETEWRIPESSTDGVPAWIRDAQGAVLAGATHFFSHPAHAVFLLSLLLLGTLGSALRLATAFTAAQLVAVGLHALTGATLSSAFAELGVLVAAAVLAYAAMRPADDRKQLVAVAAGAGLIHGLGVSAAAWSASQMVLGSTSLAATLVVLGLDAALLLSIAILAPLAQLAWRRFSSQHPSPKRCPAPIAYAVGIAAISLAFVAPLPMTQDAVAEARTGTQLADLTMPGTSGASGAAASRRLAARGPDRALQTFLSIEAFETRHETLVRLRDLAGRLDLDAEGMLAIDRQEAVKERVLELVKTRLEVTVNETAAAPVDWRIDFLTVDANGALPRTAPVPEPVSTAWIGVTAVFVTDATPTEVSATWGDFDVAAAIPATATDPESSLSVELTAESPTVRWVNALEEDPAPVVKTTAVEAETLWVPLLALVPLLAGLFLAWRAVRGHQRQWSVAGARVLLAASLLVGPIGGMASALPTSLGSAPPPARARQILAGVLPNVYRSFEFPTESLAYDRLALTVSGPILRDVYLEHRRAVQMEERGGARVRVEAVEIIDVASTRPADSDAPGGFTAEATWTVGGTVTHFGHRHFRQNRYDARITLVPVEGAWKIQAIEVLDEKRLR
jgi:hypothetical protein